MPAHPPDPRGRIVIEPDLVPSRIRATQRLLDHVLGLVPVAQVRVEVHDETMRAGRAELVEVPAWIVADVRATGDGASVRNHRYGPCCPSASRRCRSPGGIRY